MSAPYEMKMKSCNKCGARIPDDSEYCEDCGTRLSETLIDSIPPQRATQETRLGSVAASGLAAKPRRLSVKTVVAALLIVFVITLALVVPWVPLVRSKVVQQEFTYSYTYPTIEERPRKQLVFSSGNVSLNAFKSLTQSDSWTSKGFLLEKGWTIQVTFDSDSYAWTVIYVKGGWQGDVYLSTSSRYGSFVVAKSGEFYVVLQNLDPKMGHTVSVELTAEWTEVQNMDETVTQTATFDVTKYDVAYVSLIDLLLRRI